MNSPDGTAGSSSPSPVTAAVASRKSIKTDPISMLPIHQILLIVCKKSFYRSLFEYSMVEIFFQAKLEIIAQIHILTRMPVVPIVVIQKEHMITPL